MNHLISKGYDIHFCSMGSDRKYTSIFMGVLHHVQHIIYYFIMINNVCPFPYGILFYWWSVPFPVENINCYLHTWPDSVCPLIIKYIPTKSLSSCDINYLRTFTNTDAPQNDCHMYITSVQGNWQQRCHSSTNWYIHIPQSLSNKREFLFDCLSKNNSYI